MKDELNHIDLLTSLDYSYRLLDKPHNTEMIPTIKFNSMVSIYPKYKNKANEKQSRKQTDT